LLSIGLGYVAHIMRRGVNMAYIVENNGVCGLTKGQFSAAADRGSRCKKGVACAESGAADLHAAAQTSATRLNRLADAALCPGAAVLARLNASLR